MFIEWPNYYHHLQELEQQGVVTRTFRRLDPARQRSVLDAILKQAIARGPASLNITDVASEAGVAVGSLYQYFSSRENLLTFAVQVCARYLLDLFDSSLPYLLQMPLKEALRAYLSYGVEWGQSETRLVQFFGRAAYQGDPVLLRQLVQPVGERMRRCIEQLLVNAVEKGELKSGVDIQAYARLIHAATVTLGDSQLLPYLDAYFQVSTDGMPYERVVDTLLQLLENGILAGESGLLGEP